jgi:hypothetical protein
MIIPPKFKGTVANGETKYVGLSIRNGALGAQIAWKDATSAATITLDLTSFDHIDAPVTTAGTYQWTPSGLTITGPTAAAASSVTLNIENVRQKRARLKIVATAACDFEIYEGWTES